MDKILETVAEKGKLLQDIQRLYHATPRWRVFRRAKLNRMRHQAAELSIAYLKSQFGEDIILRMMAAQHRY
jgi:hypothetical protein